MNLYLHIGFPKTGSSALQAHLHVNRDWLLDKGCLVPATGHSPGYGHVHLFEDKSYALFDELEEELQRHAGEGIDKAVLSWEGVALLGPRKLQELAQRLDGHEVSIIGYIREQSEVVQSGYFQAAKQRAQKRVMEDYLRSKKLLTPRHIDYARALEKFAGAFGGEKLLIRVYERSQLLGGDIVSDLLDLLDLVPDENFVKSPGEQNISLDPGSVFLLNIIDGYFDDSPGREKLVDSLLTDIQRKGARGKFFLGQEQVQHIREHYREGNALVARRYLGRDSGALFSYGKPTHSDDQAQFPAYCAARMASLHEVVDFRPWSGQELTGTDLQSIASPASGWTVAESWGMWSDQAESLLRFRLLRTRTDPFAGTLIVAIRGEYYHENESTTVFAPGIDGTRLSLLDCRLEIPMTAIDERGRVEIRLLHDSPVSPHSLGLGPDVRKLAFGLRAISYVTGD